MAVKTVDLYISQIKEDLISGLTWLESEDLGYGSIQAKYGAKEFQIKTIKQHPKLRGLEPELTIFKVIDDEKSKSRTDDGNTESSDELVRTDGAGEAWSEDNTTQESIQQEETLEL